MIFSLILMVLFLGRINSSILGYEFLNTDEFVIGAKALRLVKNDFNIYEFDGDTSGILNALFLTWPDLINLDITYLSIRLSAIFVLSGILFFTFKIISHDLKKDVAFILFIPLLLFYSFSKDPDFLHYTNELVASFLLILTYYFMFTDRQIMKAKKAMIISFLSGSIIFAKMQFFPVAVLNIFILAIRQFLKFKDIKLFLILCFGFVLPSILLSIYYYLNQNFVDLFYNVIHYPLSDLIARNIESENVLADTNSLISISSTGKITALFNHLIQNSVFHLLYLYFFIFILFLILSSNLTKFFKDANYKLFIISSSIVLTLIISLGTGSVHRHYLIILLPMIPIFLAILFTNLNFDLVNKKIFKKFAYGFSLFFIISIFYENQKFYSNKFKHANFSSHNFNFYSPKILQYLKLESTDKIIVWGWKPEIYLLSNLSPASRDTINQKQIDFKSNRDYFRKRFIKDFNNNLPALLIDYVKPKGYMFTSKENDVSSFKELDNILSQKFVKLENFNNDCPDYYMLKEKFKKLNSKLVGYNVKNKIIELNKINDFIIDEKICDTSIIFDKNTPSKIVLEIDDKRINEIMILSSKINKSAKEINLAIKYSDKNTEYKKILIKKYPFWSKLDLKNNNKIAAIEFDITNLKNNSYGISELKILNN